MRIELPRRIRVNYFRAYRTEIGDKVKFEIYDITTGIRDFIWVMQENVNPGVLETLVNNLKAKKEMAAYETCKGNKRHRSSYHLLNK